MAQKTIRVIDADGAVQTIPVMPDIPIPTARAAQAAVVSGQVKIAVTGTAVQLPANALGDSLIVKAAISNNGSGVSVGPSGVNNTRDGTGNGYILLPGDAVLWNVANSNQLWVNGTAGDIVSWTGS